jgi:hypothetical protein
VDTPVSIAFDGDRAFFRYCRRLPSPQTAQCDRGALERDGQLVSRNPGADGCRLAERVGLQAAIFPDRPSTFARTSLGVPAVMVPSALKVTVSSVLAQLPTMAVPRGRGSS